MNRRKRKRVADIGLLIERPPERRPTRETKGVLVILDQLAAIEKSNREGRRR